MFASQTQQTIALPFAPGHTATIRKLTGREVERAQGEHLKSLVSGNRSARGWAESFKRNLAKATGDPTPIIADPLNGFDRNTIIEAGLLGWSVARKFEPEAVADLDDDAAEFIARAILKLTKPALFVTSAEDIEALQKEAQAPASLVGAAGAAAV